MLDVKGVDAKISRARECLQGLENDIAMFCEYQRRGLVFEIEQQVPIIIGNDVPELPIDYSIRVGEIAYNLRSALDHLAWQLVVDNGGTPSFQTGFPIVLEEDQYRGAAKQKLKGMNLHHIEMIQRFQPFQDHGEVGSHLLMLNSICNIDKHRRLNVVALHSSSTAHLEEGIDPELTGGTTGGLDLLDILRGTAQEDKVRIEVITDICFMDKELEAVSKGYGSAIERAGINRPPVALALSGCLTAVSFVVDRFTSGFAWGSPSRAQG